MSRYCFLAALAALLAMLPASLAAAEGKSDRVLLDELKALEDPTIAKPRLWLDTEWNRFKDGSDDIELTVGRLWAWPFSADRDFALRLKLPVKFHVPGDAPGDSRREGLGDIKAAAGFAHRLSESLRAAYGIEMRFPTAADNLGSDVWRPQLFASAAWDATPRITFSPSAEYNKSVKEEHGAAPQEFLELFFPVTFLLPDYWSVTPRYEYKVDYANDRQVTRSVKLQVGKQLKDLPLGFSLSIKKTIDETDKRFQINFVTTYYFR